MPLLGSSAEGFEGQAAPSCTRLCRGHQLCSGVPLASPGPRARAVTCAGCRAEIPFVQYLQQCLGPRQPAAGLTAESASRIYCPENLPGDLLSRACRTSLHLAVNCSAGKKKIFVNRVSNSCAGCLNGPVSSWGLIRGEQTAAITGKQMCFLL